MNGKIYFRWKQKYILIYTLFRNVCHKVAPDLAVASVRIPATRLNVCSHAFPLHSIQLFLNIVAAEQASHQKYQRQAELTNVRMFQSNAFGSNNVCCANFHTFLNESRSSRSRLNERNCTGYRGNNLHECERSRNIQALGRIQDQQTLRYMQNPLSTGSESMR